MSLIGNIRSLTARLFHRDQLAAEMDEELRVHVAMRADDLVRSGLSRDDAERRARIEFGARERYKEESHHAAGGAGIEGFVQDTHYALRMLRKSPGFAFVAVATLALGIGANAIVFSLLNALVLRTVNVPHGEQIYQVEQARNHIPSQSYLDYLDLRDRNKSFDGLAAYEIDKAGLDVDGTPIQSFFYEASGNYFDVLGIKPYIGRFFHEQDLHGYNSAPYLVLSYSLWQTRFHADPSIAGRVVRVNKFAYTVLGVAPPDFRGTELFFAPEFWAPMVDDEQLNGFNTLTNRGNRGKWIVGRLKHGVTLAQAVADLNSVGAWLSKTYPHDDDSILFALAKPGLVGNMLGGPVHAFVAGLMLLSGLILLAACANLGSLFSARASDRWREVALRLALGSTRARILRQLLTEAVLVSLGGAVAGIAGAVVLLRALSAWQPIPDVPVNTPVNPDIRTYAVAVLLALISGLLFGIVPIRQVLHAHPYQAIKTGANTGATMRRFTLRDALLALQIALCAVLVTASLVAVRGMVRSLHSSFGFNPANTMQVNTDIDMGGYKPEERPAMQRRLLDAVSAIPGVTGAAYADRVPLNIGWSTSFIYADSTTDYKPSNTIAEAVNYAVSPGYFQAAATALVAGRDFNWNDTKDAPTAAVINQELARKLFGNQNAIGGHFKIWGGTRVLVVGVVENGKYKTLSEDPTPAMFLSILQSPSSDTWLIVRSSRGTDELGPALDRTLNGMNTGLPFLISTWDRELGTALFAARAASLALGVLGFLGAMLAVTGIFGLGAYMVSRRLRELGIRIALGAHKKQVLGAALGRVFRLLAFGSAAGLALGLAATRLLSFIVYQASPRDPLVLVGVVFTMLLLGLVAAWIPAIRALRADPVMLLREE